MGAATNAEAKVRPGKSGGAQEPRNRGISDLRAIISTTMTCTILDEPPSSSSHHHLAERIIHYPIAARFGSTSNKQYIGGGACNTVPDHESITTKSHSCCIAHLDHTESCIQTRTLTEKRDNTSSKNSLMSTKCSVLLLSH